jgi:hypothetical protein
MPRALAGGWIGRILKTTRILLAAEIGTEWRHTSIPYTSKFLMPN